MAFTDAVLKKLDWDLLVQAVADRAQSEEGREFCLRLAPNLKSNDVAKRWEDLSSLRDIVRNGYKIPIGDIKNLHSVFSFSKKGQILEGVEFRQIYDLLFAVKRVQGFASDFAAKSPVLSRLKANLYPLPKIYQSIERTVDKNGEILDDATPELKEIRRQKLNLRKRIEETLSKFMLETHVATYLQDTYFTTRNEKYVIPIRLDGRGRVKGIVVDTSDSGQTLFLEPAAVMQMNENLHELEVAEKLEIIRIFRDLSAEVAKEIEVIERNYSELVQIDFLFAICVHGYEHNCGTAKIVEKPTLHLLKAIHPLIKRPDGQLAIANDIVLNDENKMLIISGPNAGGKTVVLKTVGLIHAMAKSGLLVPCDQDSKIFLFDHCYLEMGDSQNISANLSTFSGHLLGIKPILENALENDLVLLDELATGTEPQTGAAIAQATVEYLVNKNVTAITTTHFDSMKMLAFDDKRFRNGSMEYTVSNMKPTYRLILDVPGQSYGLELAQDIGLPSEIIGRAKEIRGASANTLDRAVEGLTIQREESRRTQQELEKKLIAAEQEKDRWQKEVELLNESRQKAASNLASKYEEQIETLKEELSEVTTKLKKTLKSTEDDELRQELLKDRQKANSSMKELEGRIKSIESEYGGANEMNLPGEVAKFSDLKVDAPVHVISLSKQGTIARAPEKEGDTFEVQVGMIKMKVHQSDVRTLKNQQQKVKEKARGSSVQAPQKKKIAIPELVLKTPTNSLDLRGQDSDGATKLTLDFLDKAMLRGEAAIIVIHGHGTDRLKTEIRKMLKEDCPYEIAFRPGIAQEGGDGVTIVGLLGS